MQSLELSGKECFNESIERENYISENVQQSFNEIRYENIVYQNTVAALLSGATLTSRDGKTKWSLNMDGVMESELETEARVMASYVVG